MLPKVFPLLAGDSDVSAFLGSPLRVYRHGSAPQTVKAPYVTWSLLSGLPQNTLDGAPRADSNTVQVDCWSDEDHEIEQLATAVRDAIEPAAHMISVSNSRDPETMRYRISMMFTFWTHRP